MPAGMDVTRPVPSPLSDTVICTPVAEPSEPACCLDAVVRSQAISPTITSPNACPRYIPHPCQGSWRRASLATPASKARVLRMRACARLHAIAYGVAGEDRLGRPRHAVPRRSRPHARAFSSRMIDTLHKALALRQRGLVMFAAAEFRRVPGGRTEMIEWLRESDDPARCPEGVLPGPALLVGDPQREAHVGCALGILGTALRRCPAREDAVRCRFGRLGRAWEEPDEPQL